MQHDMDIANQSGAASRADINNALLALASNNSGSAAPSPSFAYQPWADIPNDTLKIRNAANTAWISVFTISTGKALVAATVTSIAGSTGNAVSATTATNLSVKTKIKATRNAAQSIPNSIATIIIYSTEVFDTLAEYDPATGRATIGQAGYYNIHGQALSDNVAWDAGEIWQISVSVNGVVVAYGERSQADAAVTTSRTSEVNALLLLAATDIVDIRILHTQGAAVNVVNSAEFNTFTITMMP